MFRTILVPLDGTSFAEAALPVAARLAHEAGVSLHLALSHQPAPTLVGMGMGELAAATVDLDEEQRSVELGYLVGVAAVLALAGARSVAYRELVGPAGPAIREEAARLGADLVVMATHGRGAAGRLWHGSVADYVVRHLPSPVLLVHSEREGTRLAEDTGRRILVALDLSPEAESILEPVETLARLLGAPLTLMHVMAGPRSHAGKRTAIEGRLDQVAAPLRWRGLDVSTLVATGANVPEALAEALEDPRFGLLAMTTHGAGGMRRLLTGSVATRVVESAAKPVLLLRPH